MPAMKTTIPVLTFTAAPGLPVITQTTEESRIANLPGLVHYFEPALLTGSPLTGKDRATPGHPLATDAAGNTIGSEADYNDETVLIKPSALNPMIYDAGTIPTSYTVIIAADIAAAQKAADTTMVLWSFFEGTSLKAVARLSGGDLYFVDNYAVSTTGGGRILKADTPAADTPAVFVFSYDLDTRTSFTGINTIETGLTGVNFTHTLAAADNNLSTQLAIGGGNPEIGADWVGRIGNAIVLDRALHLDPYRAIFAREVAAMKAKYGIA